MYFASQIFKGGEGHLAMGYTASLLSSGAQQTVMRDAQKLFLINITKLSLLRVLSPMTSFNTKWESSLTHSLITVRVGVEYPRIFVNCSFFAA